ncbi:MAG: hypothetical protein AAGD96_16315 [Chloroflexota bacterium]
MSYRFAVNRENYSDFSSGRVFYNSPGSPVLPIRLTSEIFQRCEAIRQESGDRTLAKIYDPCCGSGYHLATLAYFHWGQIQSITGSDIDSEILQTAKKNLSLLNPIGMAKRRTELETLATNYQKESHTQALDSLELLHNQLNKNLESHPIQTKVFKANASQTLELQVGIENAPINTVIADVPYGRHAVWQEVEQANPIWQLLDAIQPLLTPSAVCAIIADKSQKCAHERYQQKGRFQIGKRRVYLLKVND